MSQFDKLIKSVKKGDVEKVSEILQQATLNINEYDVKSGKGLIQIAMQTQNQDIFDMLISYPGIDVQKPSRTGQLPLQTAILLNSLHFVQKLLQTGTINPKKKNTNHQTVLQVAIKHRTSTDIIKKLLHHKFDLNQPVDKYGNLLNLAIVNHQLDNVIFLINYHMEKNDKRHMVRMEVLDEDDNTCLILAVRENQGDSVLAILDYLVGEGCTMTGLEKQFFINAQNKQGNTALHIACLKDLQTITSIIQTRGKHLGLDTTLTNKKGQTPTDIKLHTQKQRLLQKQLKQKNQQQKRIYLKQKQQQKQRKRQQQQKQKIEERRRKKQEELLMMRRQQYEKELTQSKTKWVCGIVVVLVVGVMYLVLLNTVQSKRGGQL